MEGSNKVRLYVDVKLNIFKYPTNLQNDNATREERRPHALKMEFINAAMYCAHNTGGLLLDAGVWQIQYHVLPRCAARNY